MGRLDEQMAFILKMDKEKEIGRQTYLSGGHRKENDAEHAWHTALMTILLAEYSNEPIDVLRTVTMMLMHDVVEIEAGDTYAYDEEGKKSQKERENKAADNLYGMLPSDQRDKMRAIWEEFEACNTPESKFAHAMDNLQPIMLNDASDGKAWEEHKVLLSQLMDRQIRTKQGSETLWEYELEHYIKKNLEKGKIIDDTSVREK